MFSRFPTYSLKRPVKDNIAFTLLEAMVAVMIFGILMLAVGSLWSVCWKATERISQRDTGGGRIHLVLQRLERAVENSVFHKEPRSLYAWESGGRRGGFPESDLLSFVTVLAPDADADLAERSAPERIQVGLQNGPSGKKQLVARAAPFTMKEDDWQRETVLLDNVKSFQVRFWDGDRKDWVWNWSDGEHPPIAVQFVIEALGDAKTGGEVWKREGTARIFPSLDPTRVGVEGTTVTNLQTGEITHAQ